MFFYFRGGGGKRETVKKAKTKPINEMKEKKTKKPYFALEVK